MPIVWREEMSVGVKVIDADHRHLVDIINQLEIVIQKTETTRGEREDGLRILFGRLRAYTREHFSREEGMQSTSHYKGLRENQDHHKRLIADLEDLSQRFMEGEKAAQPVGNEDMLKFLRHWLVDHIIKVDLKMRGHPIRAHYW
ncbi:putative Bacteriohemerythrin [Rhodospirillaceae bacterium LM-1]|nr:putative Bacteriohemerythrin [Rhodospirillaceae bacterium LM-1]